MNKRKVLTSKKEILEYLGVTEYKFYRMVEQGLIAARVIDGRWYAHADNLDEFFRARTQQIAKADDIKACCSVEDPPGPSGHHKPQGSKQRARSELLMKKDVRN